VVIYIPTSGGALYYRQSPKDSAIIDPLDKNYVYHMLLGNDQFLMAYLEGFRSCATES